MPASSDVERSGAFVETFNVAPTGSGSLDGLTFGVKDLIDVAGRVTGCGQPCWRKTHPPASCHAVCVEQLLAAGAHCVGKTHTDALAFSLLGENFHYGTPLNPRAPEHVPGGSSNGSASAVACGLCDFALGTDTGGSVRYPASFCGIWGLRPSHGRVSLAGVMPFAPTYDTVGVLARSRDVLTKDSTVLLGVDPPDSAEPHSVLLVREAFAAADPAVNAALEPALARLRRRLGERLRNVSLRDVDGEAPDSGLAPYMTAYCHLQWAEIWSSLGAWIEDAKPEFGPAVAVSFDLVRRFDRRQIAHAVRLRERLARALGSFLGPGDLLCLPTAHTTAPKRGAPIVRAFDRPTFYSRALGLTALAGIGRLCQVTIPVAEADQLPVGLSLLAAHGNDASLLGALAALAPTLFPDQESP